MDDSREQVSVQKLGGLHSDPSAPINSRSGYNYSIQGFRGFATACVFVFHIFSAKVLQSLGDPVDWTGVTYASSSLRNGVELFFMISGFVILGSLRRHASLGAFFRDRVLRIYPAFVPVLLLVFAVGPIVAWDFFRGISLQSYILNFISNLLFLPGVFWLPLAHWAAWSLSYEWAFYFVAGASVFWVRRLPFRRTFFWLLGAVLTIVFNFYPRALFFIPGIVANLNLKWLNEHRRFFRFPTPALIICLSAWRLTDVDMAQPSSQLIHWIGDSRIAFGLVALLAGSYLICAVINGEGMFGKLLNTSFFRNLGTISYSFYLWHPIVVTVAKRLVILEVAPRWGGVAGALVFVVGATIGSFAISWLSWSLCENRFPKWFKARMRGNQTMSAAA